MGRKRAHTDQEIDFGPRSSPRKKASIIRPPRRDRILRQCNQYQGKVSQPTIFRHHRVSDTAGKAILASGSARTSGLNRCSKKRKLSDTNLATIETYENASFHHGTQRHHAVAQRLGFTDVSERTVQRSMADYGVETYTAAQQKPLKPERCQERLSILREPKCRTTRYWRRFAYSDKCHWGLGVTKRAKVHRRPGFTARHHPNKMQNRRKRAV